MKKTIFSLLGALVLLAMLLPAAIPPPALAGQPAAPHLVVDKAVEPDLICANAAAKVTLTVTGAGDPVKERLPVDVMLVIDRSGSMGWPSDPVYPSGPTRLDKAKEAALAFLDFLEDNPPPGSYDQVGLVSYSGDGKYNRFGVWTGTTTLDATLNTDFGEVRSAINALQAQGATCIACGLQLANEQFGANGRNDAVWVQIMLTDGIPNRPHGDGYDVFNEADAQLSRDKAQDFRNMGGTLYTIGLGGYTEISHYFLDDLPAQDHTYNPADRAGHPYDQDGLAYIGGGTYSWAPIGDDLEIMFTAIAKKIIEVAGRTVVVTEVLPEGVNYVGGSAVPSPDSTNGQTLTWNLGDISIGDTKTITFDVTFDSPGWQLTDEYPDTRVDYTNYLGDPAYEVFPETYVRVLQPVADAGGDRTIQSGQSTELDGSGSEILGGCEDVGGHIQFKWSIKDGAVIQDWSADPTVTVFPAETTTYTLEVRCSALPDCTDSDDVTVTVGDVDFSVETENYKEVDETTAEPGDTLTFTIYYKNTGNMDATDVVITDVVDDNLTNVIAQDGGIYDAVTRTITWDIGTVEADTGGSVSFTADIVSPLDDGTIIENTATIDSEQTEPVDTNTTETTVTVPPPPPPPPPPPIGVGPGAPLRYLTVDWDEEITRERLYANDRLAADLLGPNPDGRHTLLLERGTLAPTVNGERHYLIVIRDLEEIPPLPENTMAAVAINVTPKGAQFDRDIFLTLGFDALPDEAVDAYMAYYDDGEGVWVLLDAEPVDPNGVAELNLSAPLRHFSIFGVLVELEPVPPPPPATFAGSDLNIVPSVEKIWETVTFVTKTGENVTITAKVTNDGGQEGSYTAQLKLNGTVVDSRSVTLGAGQSQYVSFTLSDLDVGEYEVEVAGLSGEFTTSRTITWWLIIVLIVAFGLIIWGAVWGRRRRRPSQQA